MNKLMERKPVAKGTQRPPRPAGTRSWWWLATGSLIAIAAIGLAGAYAGWFSSDETNAPAPNPGISDGRWFALVSPGTDESGAVTLGVDPAEMLSGEAARLAAIEDGVIADGEDLPNDVYIRNPSTVSELMAFSSDPEVRVVSAVAPGTNLSISPERLEAVYAGREVDETIYGIVPGTPIAMDLTVTGGLVSQALAVYLP